MSNTSTQTAFQPVAKNIVFTTFSDKNSTPRLTSIYHICKQLVSSEVSRLQEEAAFAIMTETEINHFKESGVNIAEYFKTFFAKRADRMLPVKKDFQLHLNDMIASYETIDGKAKANFKKRLEKLDELRNPHTVFTEYFIDLKTMENNTFKGLLTSETTLPVIPETKDTLDNA